MNILGVSALYHDSAACLVRDGEIVAAAQQERFSRKKHDAGIPSAAMAYCIEEGKVDCGDLDIVVFYDKPLSKFSRLLTTYAQVAPRGLRSFLMAVPVWLREKAWASYLIERDLLRIGVGRPRRFLFSEHHHAHAASAFYPSPFDEAAIITVDGVGEWTTTAIGTGRGRNMRLLFEQHFPHSLGLLYSAFTYFTGFRVNSGEYKLMGLAPYGEPRYVDTIKKHLIDVRHDGSFRLNMDYFGYLSGLRMTNQRFAALFGRPPRAPESDITTQDMDLAASIQKVTEEVMLNMTRYARVVTGQRNLCLAGGVALNCVANGKILREQVFDDIWIQPAAGDAGGALGAALYVWHHILGHDVERGRGDRMHGSLLGPSFTPTAVRAFLESNGLPFEELDDDARDRAIADAVADEKVVGLCAGRMEFGPRALGNRSILADARSPKMQSYLNLATKFRESFRPFAPIVLEEDAAMYFQIVRQSPYMLLVDQVSKERCIAADAGDRRLPLKEWVNIKRSDIPAVTHVDYSARVQTVDRERNPRLHRVLSYLKERTGYGVAVNTSFNVRSEPIVATPEDAYRCFMRTGIDLLVLDNFILRKTDQPPWAKTDDWREQFGLD